VFQIELSYRASMAGFSIDEIPIVFRGRERGESKMTAAVALEAAWRVPLLRLRRRSALRTGRPSPVPSSG
jgi:dolichol-phosphate mannosyltransferase